MKPTLSEGQDMLRLLRGSFAEIFSHGVDYGYGYGVGYGYGYGEGYGHVPEHANGLNTEGDQDE